MRGWATLVALSVCGCSAPRRADPWLTGAGGGPTVAASMSAGAGGQSAATSGEGGGCAFGSHEDQLVIDRLVAPHDGSDDAFDLSGGGQAENRYGALIAALAAQGLDPQAGCDSALAAGPATLIDVDAGDPSFQNWRCAMVMLLTAQQQGAPDYSGQGHFAIDPSGSQSMFVGPFAAGRFESQPEPAKSKYAVQQALPLCLTRAGAATVTLWGARMDMTVAAGAVQGRLNGAIRAKDVTAVLAPALATQLTALIQAGGSQAAELDQRYDIGDGHGGDCLDPDQSHGVPGDHVVAPCELGASVLGPLLAPDLQLFDGSGKWAPSATADHPDALSVGIGLHAVAAKF